MNNLVTGGTGFLGSHLIEALLARGERVRALVRPASDRNFLQRLGVELCEGSLQDRESLRQATEGVERVYHCAALAADWGPWSAFEAANVDGVRHLLDASVERGVRKFVHISTTDVYGHPDHGADEDTPHRCRGWPYGDTKIRGERLVWDYYRRRGLPVTIIRPANIYGPRSTTFVGEIVALLQKREMIHIGHGNRPAGLAYVTNVVDLILLAADHDAAIGQAFNASDGSSLSWRQYVNRLADIIHAPQPAITIPHRAGYALGWTMEKTYGLLRLEHRPLLTRMAVELFATDQGFPINKARDMLGYRPAVGFDEGMQSVEDWLRETGVI